MKDHDQALSKFTEIAGHIDHSMKEGKNVSVYMAQNFGLKPTNQFVMLFAESLFSTIEQYKLRLSDVKVILKIISYAQFGNLLKFSNKKLAEDVGMQRTNLNACLRNLKKCGILLEVEENLYLNPQVIAKGELAKLEDMQKEIDLVEYGAKVMQEKINMSPNIVSNKMKKKIREQNKNSKVENNQEEVSEEEDLKENGLDDQISEEDFLTDDALISDEDLMKEDLKEEEDF